MGGERLGSDTAHPRVSGENPNPWPPTKIKQGSSPRERGKLGPFTVCDYSARLIPA